MFGMIDRYSKNAHVYCVLDNRTKESLIPLIKNDIYTTDDINVNNYQNVEDIHKYCISTRIYSDCWGAYQRDDFKEIGLVLHRVNHSVWFGHGNFHTNTIEGLWSQLKRLCSDFSGINTITLNNLSNNGEDVKGYIDDWICYALFLCDIERFKLNKNSKFDLLLHYIKFNK